MSDTQILQRVACKAVIVKNNKVLILREAKTYDEGTNVGRYGLPGGRINPGEPFKHGLLREVTEETGLDVEIGDILFAGEWYPEIKGVKNHIVALFFSCKPLAGKITLSIEHDDYQWVDMDTLGKFAIVTPDDDVIVKYYTKS